jgi:hypothetical protein
MKLRHAMAFVLLFSLEQGCSSRTEAVRAPKAINKKLHPDCIEVLENTTEFEVLSIDPETIAKGDGSFLGYRMLGKTAVTDSATRKEIAAAIYASLNTDTGGAFCFDPRHGVRALASGKCFEFVIGFECSMMHVYSTSARAAWQYPISSAAEPALTRVLVDAGVPLAPK